MIKPYNECKAENYQEIPLAEFGEWRDKQADEDLNTHHEVIRGRVRPYFDYEVDFDCEDDMLKNHKACLEEAANEIQRAFRRKGELVWGDSSGFSESKQKWRISGRFFLRGAGYYRKPEHLKAIVEKFTVKGFDTGVYHTGKTMRNFYCRKEGGDKRLLVRAFFAKKTVLLLDQVQAAESLGESWKDWTCGDYYNAEKKCLSPDEDEDEKEDEEGKDTGYIRKPMPLAMIKGYVSALSAERATSRGYRRVVIMALRQLADYQDIDLRDLAHDFATGAGENYDEAKVEDTYENPDRKANFTFNVVIGWARKDCPDIEHKLNPPLPEDQPPKQTFYNDYRSLLIRNDATVDDVKEYMRGCIAKVSNNGNSVFFTHGEDGWTLLCGKEPFPYSSAAESYTLTVSNPAWDKKKKDSPKMIEMKYSDIYKELQKCPVAIRHCSFDRVNFKPYPGAIPPANLKRIFNTFTGFRFQKRADFKPTGKCDLLLTHLREVLADGNAVHYNYILDWTAHMFQNPDDKVGVCLIFVSKPRAGKNTYWDFIRNKLLPEYSIELSEMERLTQKHNAHLMNKMLITLNEVANGAGFKDHNRLKAIITDLTKTIEPKGQKSFQIDDFSRYVMLTNNQHTVKKEDAERYTPFQCSNKRCGDLAYFKELRASMTEECAEEFFQILAHRNLSKSEVRAPPQTACGNEMSRNSATTAIKFIVEVADREELHDEESKEDEIRIHRDPLYDTYVAWARRSNAHLMSKEAFTCELNQLMGHELKPVRVSGVQKRGIHISMHDLRAKLKALPAYSDYEFQE